jgi:hypothetical protein
MACAAVTYLEVTQHCSKIVLVGGIEAYCTDGLARAPWFLSSSSDMQGSDSMR